MNIRFEILNLKIKNPKVPSIILTTSKEALKITNSLEKLKILPYSKDSNFNHYILKVLAAYRIGYKDFYSELIITVDPGSKQIGAVIFLDDFFLISHTFYNKQDFIAFTKKIISYFQNDNPNLILLKFKFGSGVLPLTFELIDSIFDIFYLRKKIKVYLIDESKSSKTKIKDYKRRVKTKHEISALLLSLRRGVEVTQSNFKRKFKQNKLDNSRYIRNNNVRIEKLVDSKDNLQELIDKILNNEISLSKSIKILNENIVY